MSKLFEALTRGQEIPKAELETLLDGQTANGKTSTPLGRVDAPVATATAELFQGTLASVRTVPLRVTSKAPVLPFDGTHPRAGEQYRILRTKINQHPKAPQFLVITSAGPSDGKSVTAINLAAALALKGESRVLIIDGDFRRSTVHKQLGIPPTPGLADVLMDVCTLHEALIQAEQIPNLYILPAGNAMVNPAELLDSVRWNAFIEFSRAEFKYIVIDSPPIGPVADYDLIQAVCDGAILVVRPDHTDRQLCLKAIKQLPKEKLLGVVLNCVEPWFLDRDRQYGSYYYAHNPGAYRP